MAQDANTVNTAEIRSQIERTRVELGHTIDAIQDRLSPRRVIHDAKETISDATIGRARRLAHRVSQAVSTNGSTNVSAVVDTVRRNPTMTALIGGALGAVILAAVTRSRRPRLARSLGGLAVSLVMAVVAQQRSQRPSHL